MSRERRDDEVESICQRRPRPSWPLCTLQSLGIPSLHPPFCALVFKFQKRAPPTGNRTLYLNPPPPLSLSLCEVINRPFVLFIVSLSFDRNARFSLFFSLSFLRLMNTVEKVKTNKNNLYVKSCHRVNKGRLFFVVSWKIG